MKIRMGFVSNSSSSAFVMPLYALRLGDLDKLALAFGNVHVSDEEVMVVCHCGSCLANKILQKLFADRPADSWKWTSVS